MGNTDTNLGKLVIDQNRNAINTWSGFTLTDITGTPITSPVTITATTGTKTLLFPTKTMEVMLKGSASGLTIALGSGTYLLGTSDIVLGVAGMSSITVTNTTAGDIDLYFMFGLGR